MGQVQEVYLTKLYDAHTTREERCKKGYAVCCRVDAVWGPQVGYHNRETWYRDRFSATVGWPPYARGGAPGEAEGDTESNGSDKFFEY